MPRKDCVHTRNSVLCTKRLQECDISRTENYKNSDGVWKEFPPNTSILLPRVVPKVFPELSHYIRSVKTTRQKIQKNAGNTIVRQVTNR